LSNLTVIAPHVVSIEGAFYNLPLAGTIDAWNLSSVTGLADYAGIGHNRGRLAQTITGTVHLPSVTVIGTASLPAGVTGIDFDRARLVSVAKHWGSWDAVLPLATLWFRGAMPPVKALDNLMTACEAVDGQKKMTIYCSRHQKGWAGAVAKDYTAAEATAAGKLQQTLAPEERLLGIYVTQAGERKAWVVHQPSVYDAHPTGVIVR
jgi:hypothetical protein